MLIYRSLAFRPPNCGTGHNVSLSYVVWQKCCQSLIEWVILDTGGVYFAYGELSGGSWGTLLCPVPDILHNRAREFYS